MKHSGSRYTIVALFLLSVALLHLASWYSSTKNKMIVSLLIVVVTCLSVQNLWQNFKRFEKKIDRLQALDSFVRPLATDPKRPIIAFGYMEPMWPSWALLFASGRADDVLTESPEKT